MTPRFSLSSMLLVITLICVCMAWYLDRTALVKKYRANCTTLTMVLDKCTLQKSILNQFKTTKATYNQVSSMDVFDLRRVVADYSAWVNMYNFMSMDLRKVDELALQ